MTYLDNHTKIYSNRKTINTIICKQTINKNFSTVANNQLGYYLAGLIEGDGSIILRKGKQENISPKIVFTFNINEIPMYEKLKEILNTGIIYRETGGICRYSITNSEAVINVINLINGKFRTPKIVALHKAIDNLNRWRNYNVLKLPLDTSSLDSNAWLAGFIDTDGHFSIKLTVVVMGLMIHNYVVECSVCLLLIKVK
uniref:LAGLIDADG endonuclease n=1 Tax=Cordyceps cicadae TaxID=218633 RepID=A0A481S1T8_9HYPO|nr:LAGLIDADG endonuclease [Cordyceps cicadae]